MKCRPILRNARIGDKKGNLNGQSTDMRGLGFRRVSCKIGWPGWRWRGGEDDDKRAYVRSQLTRASAATVLRSISFSDCRSEYDLPACSTIPTVGGPIFEGRKGWRNGIDSE